MPLPTTTNLLDEIRAGSYSPSALDKCDDKMPRDRNPHRVRMIQFFFFTPEKPAAPGHRLPQHLILQKHLLQPAAMDAEMNSAISQIAAKAATSRVAADIKAGKLVDPADPKVSIDAIRNILAERKVFVGRDVSEAEIRSRYSAFVQSLGRKERGWLAGLLDRFGKPPLAVAATAAEIADAIRENLFPPPFAGADSAHPQFALCAVYEQTWSPLGYTRGDLVGSVSLAPGEQVTLEFHSWDKTTTKSEEELTTESELRISSKLTRRDTQEVVGELASEFGSKMNGSFSLGVPIGTSGATFGAEGGAETTNQIRTGTKSTLNTTSERTEEAALTLKNLRKTRVEVARDAGKENKQTRVIVNANRGHALNCNYFEVMANYFVETRFVEYRPCVFLPFRRPPIERKWVLSHEFVLRQALLDPSFLPGFEAAKLLEVSDALVALQPVDCVPPGTPAAETECGKLRGAILAVWNDLAEDADEAVEAMTGPALLFVGLGFPAYWGVVLVRLGGNLVPVRRALYLALVRRRPEVANALRALGESAGSSAREALMAFFAVVGPADFQIGEVSKDAEGGLTDLGLPGAVANLVLAGGALLNFATDDAGLAGAVRSAHQRLTQMTNPAPVAATTPPTESKPGYATRDRREREELPLMQRAEAIVEYERLRAHLTEYGLHYHQAVWLRTHPDDRSRFLRAQGIPGTLLAEEILGFQDDKAAYPIANPAVVKKLIDFDAIIAQASGQLKAEKPRELLVSLPTPSTILETKLGECDACEEYIVKSREIELREKTARARQEEAEADRRGKRIGATPPNLEEFVTTHCPEEVK